MFRLTFYLLAGIWLAMYFAPDAPAKAPKASTEAAVLVPTAPTDGNAASPASMRLDRAPKTSPTLTRESRYQMVSFLDPVVIGPDGQISSSPTTIAAADPAKAEALTQPDFRVLFVTADRVNVREGPSTAEPVLGSVEFAEAVQVLTDPGQPWVLIRIEGDGIEGYMSSKFLAEINPEG